MSLSVESLSLNPGVSTVCFHSRAGEAEGGGEAQHVSKLRPEEGSRQRGYEPRQSGRQLRHGRGSEEERPQQLPAGPL